jgi:hypothetical protein
MSLRQRGPGPSPEATTGGTTASPGGEHFFLLNFQLRHPNQPRKLVSNQCNSTPCKFSLQPPALHTCTCQEQPHMCQPRNCVCTHAKGASNTAGCPVSAPNTAQPQTAPRVCPQPSVWLSQRGTCNGVGVHTHSLPHTLMCGTHELSGLTQPAASGHGRASSEAAVEGPEPAWPWHWWVLPSSCQQGSPCCCLNRWPQSLHADCTLRSHCGRLWQRCSALCSEGRPGALQQSHRLACWTGHCCCCVAAAQLAPVRAAAHPPLRHLLPAAAGRRPALAEHCWRCSHQLAVVTAELTPQLLPASPRWQWPAWWAPAVLSCLPGPQQLRRGAVVWVQDCLWR